VEAATAAPRGRAVRDHREPRRARDDIEPYAEAGVHRVVVLPWHRGREAEEQLGRLAAAVLR